MPLKKAMRSFSTWVLGVGGLGLESASPILYCAESYIPDWCLIRDAWQDLQFSISSAAVHAGSKPELSRSHGCHNRDRHTFLSPCSRFSVSPSLRLHSNKYVFIPAVPDCVCQVHSEIFAQVALFGNGSDRCWTFSLATKRQGHFSCRPADHSSCFYC